MIIYTSAAKIVIDHTGLFKCAFGNFYKESDCTCKSLLKLEGKPRTCHQTSSAVPTELGEFFSSWGLSNVLKLLGLLGHDLP